MQGAKTLGDRNLSKALRTTQSKFQSETNRPTVTQELVAHLGQPGTQSSALNVDCGAPVRI